MDKKNEISIEWEASGYSVLKNLNASILGIFSEFIDNSIQSFNNDKELIKKYDEDAQLIIKILASKETIIIEDNAGGINSENFKRALKPANKPDDTKGLNEFGLGMKYAAVWLSNEWELISSAIGEEVERKVTFNYKDVTENNLKTLPTREKKVLKNKHYTKVILRQLEKERIYGWSHERIKDKLSSSYRNFLREKNSFYNDFRGVPAKIKYNGDYLKWEEYSFYKGPWYKDLNINKKSDPFEWKYKLDWQKLDDATEEIQQRDGTIKKVDSKIEIAGFIGILPSMDQKRNGLYFFRRGRVIEGLENRIFPHSISGQVGSPRYKRLYGEIHFRNVGVSFDKSKLVISRSQKDEIFFVLSQKLKKITFNNSPKVYNLLAQAQKMQARADVTKRKEKVEESIKKDYNKKDKSADEAYKNKKLDSIEINEEYIKKEEERIERLNALPKTEIKYPPRLLKGNLTEINIIQTDDGGEYLYQHTSEANKVDIFISINHNIFNQLNNNEKVLIDIIVNLVFAEKMGQTKEDMSRFFNSFITEYS